jgi:hypothetical protein
MKKNKMLGIALLAGAAVGGVLLWRKWNEPAASTAPTAGFGALSEHQKAVLELAHQVDLKTEPTIIQLVDQATGMEGSHAQAFLQVVRRNRGEMRYLRSDRSGLMVPM